MPIFRLIISVFFSNVYLNIFLALTVIPHPLQDPVEYDFVLANTIQTWWSYTSNFNA